MAEIKTGGAAFPLHPGVNPDWQASAGMSLRDWFAGQAMSHIAAKGYDPKTTAEWAYSQADAMLAERDRDQ